MVERLRPGGVGGQQGADAAHPARPQPSFQFGQEGAADPTLAPAGGERDQQDPGAFAVRLRHGHADQFVTDDRDHRGLTALDRGHHLGDREGGPLVGRPALVPDLDRLVEIVIVVVAQMPCGHRHHLAGAGCSIVTRCPACRRTERYGLGTKARSAATGCGSALGGGPYDDLVHVDGRGLFDGERDGPGDRVGRDRDAVAHRRDLRSDLAVGRRLGEVGGRHAR